MHPVNYSVSTDLEKVNHFLSRMLDGNYLIRVEATNDFWRLIFSPSLERSSAFDLTVLGVRSPFGVGDRQRWSESIKMISGADTDTERHAWASMRCTALLGCEILEAKVDEFGLLEIRLGDEVLFVEGKADCCCEAWSLNTEGVGITIESEDGAYIYAHPLLGDLLS
ncbi:MAG: hypothetical protein AB7W16_02570 [Candidatus Obscuribacterales bacterium]